MTTEGRGVITLLREEVVRIPLVGVLSQPRERPEPHRASRREAIRRGARPSRSAASAKFCLARAAPEPRGRAPFVRYIRRACRRAGKACRSRNRRREFLSGFCP